MDGRKRLGGGRESLYGDVFEHHSVLYEFAQGVWVYAFGWSTSGGSDENSNLRLIQ